LGVARQTIHDARNTFLQSQVMEFTGENGKRSDGTYNHRTQIHTTLFAMARAVGAARKSNHI
jgi:hypothetical protein